MGSSDANVVRRLAKGDEQPSGRWRARVKWQAQSRQRRNASVASGPPNPKPLEMAASTSAFRAVFGT